MALINNQKGFGLVEGILIVVALAIIGGTGYYVYNANKSKPAPVAESPKKTSDKAPATDEDPTKDWKKIAVSSGKYSFKVPKTWQATVDDELCSKDLVLVAPDLNSLGKCASEGFGQIMVALQEGSEGSVMDDKEWDNVKMTSATADGVTGTRYEGTYSPQMETIGPPVGSTQVFYSFKVGNSMLNATYTQEPGFADVKKEFDLLVTKTLDFN